MACYCVEKRKPIRCEKPKPQTSTVVSLWFWVCSYVLNLIVIGHYTINIPEIFQPLTVF